jgi:hypothetical protein
MNVLHYKYIKIVPLLTGMERNKKRRILQIEILYYLVTSLLNFS